MKPLRLCALLAVPFAVACSTGGEATDAESADPGASEDDLTVASALVGTWQLDDDVDGEGQMMVSWLARVALKKDGTCWYDEEGPVFDQDGMNMQIGHFDTACTYQLRKASDGKSSWIAFAFTAPDGKKATQKYFYRSLRSGKVQLSADIRGKERDRDFFGMHRTDDRAWCAAPSDCELQNLSRPRCAGAWACDQIRPDKVLTYTVPACVFHETCGH